MRRIPLIVLFLWVASPARANSIADEIAIGATSPSPSDPRAGFYSDGLRGVFDVTHAWTVRGALTWTHDEPSPPQNGASFGGSGGDVFAGALGADWSVNEYFDLSGEVTASPTSTNTTDAPLSFATSNGRQGTTDALVATRTTSYGVTLAATLHTAGGARWEYGGALSIGATQFDTDQAISQVATRSGSTDLQRVRDACTGPLATETQSACAGISPALTGKPVSLDQLRLGAIGTVTFDRDTDGTLAAAFCVYNQDPTQAGYFSRIVQGRTSDLSESGGAGVPVAPLLFTVRPSVAHRFGPLSVQVWYQYGQFASNIGYGNSAGAKVQYAVSRDVRLWLAGSWEGDVSSVQSGVNTSGAGSAGVKLNW